MKAKHAQQVGAIQQRLATIAIERDKAQTARNKLLQTSPERQRLAKLQDEHAAAVIALQGALQVALRGQFPELGGGPVYIRTDNEVPTIERVPRALAWTGAALDVRLRPILEQRGQWFGRGLAIVVEHVDRFFAMTWPEQLGILTHETAHQFDSWDSPQRRDDFQWTARDEWLTSENIDRICAALGMPPITDEEVEPINHGSAFTRAALHCWWRCRYEIGIDQMQAFDDVYRSPDFDEAFSSLRSELDGGGTIVDVMRTPMPETFAKLWT